MVKKLKLAAPKAHSLTLGTFMFANERAKGMKNVKKTQDVPDEAPGNDKGVCQYGK